jgi:RimJ/RimL family protein N-acetyltransferase
MNIAFRALTTADLPTLHEWLTRPHVREWWDDPSTWDEVVAEYGPVISGEDSTRAYIAMLDGEPIGFIQSYVVVDSPDGWWTDERNPGVRGIDQFLANAHQLNRGLGTSMVRAFVEHVFEDPAVTHIQTDPSPDNARAIRCYEKAGFRPVGPVVTPDGPALLMICDRRMIVSGVNHGSRSA